MKIANPIYDVVFKFLMEDLEVAKLVIEPLIQEEILELEPRPQESTVKLEKLSLTVYRLDFSAKIKTTTGYKLILIEIQKAKFPTDIIRFRRYLGSQYMSKQNVHQVTVEKKRKNLVVETQVTEGIPILNIYFLGYPLDIITAPLIDIKRGYYDRRMGKEIKANDAFIEGLTHDGLVVQIPYLQEDHKLEVEDMLSMFDQKFIKDDQHELILSETMIPEKYRPILRRLEKAMQEPKIQDLMDAEDEILGEFEDMERDKEILEEALAREKEASAQKEAYIKMLEEKLARAGES
jgi:hypothetical protein